MDTYYRNEKGQLIRETTNSFLVPVKINYEGGVRGWQFEFHSAKDELKGVWDASIYDKDFLERVRMFKEEEIDERSTVEASIMFGQEEDENGELQRHLFISKVPEVFYDGE